MRMRLRSADSSTTSIVYHNAHLLEYIKHSSFLVLSVSEFELINSRISTLV